MNPAHWHLLVNHLPIVGGLLATLILAYGIWQKNEVIMNLSYKLFIFCAVCSLIASSTGENAEHYLVKLNALDENYLERHVEAADIANYAMILVGILSLSTLISEKIKNFKYLSYAILLLSIITFALMARAGKFGGEIMHKEIRVDNLKI